jgi:TolA-binding protein
MQQVQQFMHKVNQMDHLVKQVKEEHKISLHTMGGHLEQLNKDIEGMREEMAKQNQHLNAQHGIIKRLLACTKNDQENGEPPVVASIPTVASVPSVPSTPSSIDRSNASLIS